MDKASISWKIIQTSFHFFSGSIAGVLDASIASIASVAPMSSVRPMGVGSDAALGCQFQLQFQGARPGNKSDKT